MSEVHLLNNAEHWRDRAEETRVLAEEAHDPQIKEMLLGITKSYEILAEHAERRRIEGRAGPDVSNS